MLTMLKSRNNWSQTWMLAFTGIAILILLAACGGDGGDGNADATAAALAAALNQPAVTDAGNGSTEAVTEAEPGATAAPPLAPDENLVSIQTTATAQAAERAADQAAENQADAAAAQATADAAAPIKAELPTYGIDPSEGELAWIHPPITVFAEGYLQFDYKNQNLATVAQDFVLSADITWNTQFGTTGCGFVVRSDGNEESINQYLIVATRGGNGRVIFAVQEEGEVDIDDATDIYATGIDPQFQWQNDTTNRLTVVGRGDIFSIYSNGTYLGEVTGYFGFDKGFVAFVALNESGTTTCQFDNAWLWLLN